MARAKLYRVTYRPAPGSETRRGHDRIEITEFYRAANPVYAVKKAEEERGDKIEVLRVVEVIEERSES